MATQPQPQPQPKGGNAEEGGRAAFWGDIDSPEDDAWANTIFNQMMQRASKKPGSDSVE